MPVISGTNSPIFGTWGSSIVGTYDVASGTIDNVNYLGATFGNDGAIAVLDGPGTLESSGSAFVNQFGGNVQLQIGDGITWSNGGTIDQDGAMQFGTAAADSATIINQVGAIYDLTSGESQLYVDGAGSYNFINNGLLEMTGGGSDTLQAALTNSGVVSADNGDFYLSGDVTNSGTLQSDGGFLEIKGGVLGGTIQALSGNVGLIGTYTIAGTIGTVTFNNASLGWFGDGEATFTGPGTLVSLGNVHVSQYGANNQLTLTGGVTWDNNGIVYQDGDIVLGIGTNDSATIVNLSGAVYDLTSGNSQLRVGNPGTYGFVNAGLLEMTGGGSDTLSMPLDNTGLVSAQNGNLYLGGLTTNSDTLQSDQGNLILYGGTLGGLIENSSTNGADVFLTGTYAVPADTTDSVIFDGVYFGWGSGGVAALAGPGTLASNGLINTYQYGGNVQLQLTGGMTWANAGTVNQMGAVQLGTAAGDTATIVNQAGATYELTSGNSQIYGNGTGTYNFINAGLLEMVGGGTNTIYVNLTNTGLISANNGNLVLAGPVSSSGTLEANGGQLYVEGGTLGGLIRVNPQNGGNVYLIDTYTVAAGPDADVTFGGAYFGDTNAAVLTGPGTLVSGGSVNVYQYGGNAQLFLEGDVTWENTGTVNQNGAVQFVANAGTGATIINQAGALYELTSQNSQITASGAGPFSFVNQGTLVMTGGGNDYISVPLTNTGLLSAANGNLIVNGGFSNTGTLQADGGTLFLTGGTLGGTIQNLAGNVYLQGTFSLPANVADVTFGGATLGDQTEAVLTGPGTLTTTGSVNVYQYGGDTQLLLQSAINWDNAGTVNQNGAVEFGAGAGDSATVVNQANAVWELTSGNAQIYIDGTGSYNYVNAGTFEMLGGGNDHIAVAFSNAGLVTTNGGGLYFDGPIANSGTLLTEGGGMQLGGGTLGGAILASDGGITLLGTYTAAAGTIDTVTFGGATFGNGNAATLAGPGTIASGGSVNVYQFGGDAELVLTGGVAWQNTGVVNQNGALEFGAAAGDTATIVNEGGAVYELTSGNAQIYGDGAGSYTFVNAGLLEMVGGGTNNIAAAIDETATGTITNTTGNLNFNAGGTIAGLVTGNQPISFSGNVLLASTGDITASNVTFNGGTLAMRGGTIAVGSLSLAGADVVGYGTIGDLSNTGRIDAAGGLLTVNGAITGSGSLQVETGATLDIAGTTAQNVTFDGIDATLQLGSPSGFSGAIAGFGAGDTIDFEGEVLNHVSIASGHLIGTLSTGGTMSVAAPGVASGLQLSYSSDGDGGTDVSLAPASTTAVPQIVTTLGADNSIVLPDVHVAFAGGSAGTFSDSLEDGINPAFWSASLTNPPFYTDSTGPDGVTFEKAANSTAPESIQAAGLNLNLAALGGDIAGNFSVTVSWEDADISGGGLDQVELHTSYSDGSIFFDSRSQQGGSGDAHVWTGSQEGSVATNGATSGTFTITRVGDVVSGYYDGALIYSETGSTADLTAVAFTLQNNEGSDDNTAVTLNDFSITASSIPASSGTPDEQNVAIANAATGSADGLNVAVGTATGDAYGSGSIAALAPGATDDTSIAVGLNDTTAGSQSGTVALDYQSDGSVSGNVANLGDETLNLSGSVYAYASPSISAPTNVILHTGDDGGTATEALTVANTAPADGFSEGLDAAATGAVTDNLLSASGATPDIAAGSSNDSAITVSFSTAQAGTISGDVAVAETSDGTGIDTLGLTPLGVPIPTSASGTVVPVTVTINNYATAAVEQASGPGTLSVAGDTYTLNLGAVAIGPGAVSDTLDIANTATGPADWLSGSLGASGDSAFNDSGVGAFSTMSAGGTTPLTVDLATSNSGTFEQTITLTPTDSNAAGFDEALAAETIDVVGTVLPNTSLAQATINEPSPLVLPDVHIASLVPNDQTTLNISNTGSDTLSGAVVTASGNAYASGSFSGLAPDGNDSTDITVGLNNTSAGAKSGSVTLAFSSGGYNLVSDGSFEDASDFVGDGRDGMLLSAGSTVLQGWTVLGGNQIAWIGPTNSFGVAAEDGGYFLDLTGYADSAPYGGVSQTIATTIGEQYQLSFWLGSSSIWGTPDSLTASAGSTSESFTSTLTGSENWQVETLDFTATGATTAISLVGTSPAHQYIGLDNVVVESLSAPTPVALNPQTVAVSGNVYNYATASIAAPANVYLHVGDDGGSYTENLTVANTAATGLYSEGLEASAVGGAGGAVTGASGTTGDIAAGGSDDTSLSVTFSTAAASTGGEVAVAEISDGTGIDSLGTTSLGTVDVAVNISVNNYATAAVEQLGGDGNLTPSGVADTYTLNLGSTYQYSNALSADLGALNAAAGPAADVLNGSFAISGDSEFADTGFNSFSGVSFGNAAGNNDVVLNTGTIGTFTQQVTLDPTGSNPSGFSGTLAAETIDVVGTILAVPPPPPPPLPVATVWGDVHITTFDGLYYNFQAEGEFVLAESTVAGDSFQVQGRMEPYSEGATVSVLTMLAAEVGTDRVTFGLNRTDVVSVNGTQEAMGIGTTIDLSGGTLTQTSSTGYQLTWNTGEVAQVTDAGSYLNMNLTLARSDGPGSVQGLLGSDTGQANDFQLANGTVLQQPLSSADLYGEFAASWRVTSGAGGNSLMDYAPGQGTSAFTDLNFPTDSIGVGNLPAAIAQEAELEVQEAGITDPNLAAAAVIDLLVTGDPTALLNDLNVNQTGETTSAAVITSPPPPIPALGVSANASNVIETAGGTTDVTFTAYLTNASGTDTVIDWAVTVPSVNGASYLSAAAFGGSFPSGFVVIPAGQTTTQFTVNLPEGVLGSQPSSNLQVAISSTNGDPVFGQVAQTEIDNYTPEPGNPAIAQLTLLSGAGTFSGSDGNYTLNVGTLVAGESPVQDRFQIANVALAPSDLLTGSIAASGSGFTVYGAQQITPLAAGENYQGLVTEATSGQTGTQSETIVFAPVDENITGYSSIQASQTLVITDTVVSAAVGDLLTGGPVNLGTFNQGAAAETALSIENAAASGAAGLDVTTSASGDATAGGGITDLAPGGINNASVVVGIDTSSPGVKTGFVTVDYTSDAGDGNTASAGSQQIEVEGTVYGPAVAALSAAPVYVHPGDDNGSVVVPITVSNTGTTNGYAENLIATVLTFGSPVTSASGSVVDLAPGHSNDIGLSATLADASYGTYSGEVAVTLESDGTGIDSNGTTSIGIGFVQATVNVDQYAVAAIEQTGGDGTLTPTGVATAYALNLGAVAQYSTPLGASLAVLNDVLGAADDLEGGFSIAGAPEFTNTGFGAFGPGTGSPGVAAGQTDSQPIIVLSSGTVGVFTETITLDPAGYNPSGYQAGLTPETVTVTGTVVAAPPPTPEARVADAWGDVHLTTFDGLYYNFMAAGEFVLTESTIPGDSFAIQARMQPWSSSSSVSVNTMIAAQVGNDRVTFGIDRTDVVWIDGAGVSLSGNPVVTLADGTLEQTSADSYRLVWNTGEELDITDDGSYLNATISLPASDEGNVQGLLGNDAGNPADDLTLPGGVPIASGGTITYAQLYGTYAASWEVTDSTSLMDYGPGQDAGSFFNPNFPYNQIGLGNLPANAVQQALAAAEAAGITDPNLQQAAIIDYLFTGNPDALQASENVQQQEGTGTTTGQTLTEAPPPAAVVGVQANEATEVESTTGAEAVGFTVYLTSPEAQNVVINYAVSADPGAGFIPASEIGGPSGAVTIEAGATSAVFTVALQENVLGSAAYEDLQVVISPQNPEQGVFAPLAQTEILNTGPTEGNLAQPLLDQTSGDGSLTGSDTSYMLNLGTVEQFANPLEAGWGVANGAIAPADLLSGSFVVNGSTQFLNNGLATFAPLAAGNADTAPAVELPTNQVGTFTETVILSPTDSNATGFSAALNTVTLEVTGTVVAPPPPPPPPVPEATSWGDVHITTFDGLYYNFQAAGEYVLTKSTVAGDTFQVQTRLQPFGANSSVSVQTEIGAAVGSDDIVFAANEASPFYLDGAAYALGVGQTLNLSGGSVTELSSNAYRVNWDTGETMNVSLAGSYINDTIALTAADAGNVQGLLGPDDGSPSGDLQLPSGQPIASNGTIASSTLYGVYAGAWQVPNQANSLLYYGNGESFDGFDIPGFPEDALTLSQLPTNLVAAAEAIVEAEGITNPNLIDAAVIDLLVTGNPNSVFSSENVQEEGVLLSSAAVSIPTPLPSVGIMADSTTVLEPTTGTLAVDYTIYLTAAAAQSSTVDYSVTGSGPNNLGTADIVGGTGSGVVQIAKGQTSTQITVDVLANALGSLPDAELQVGITATGGESVFGGTAETEIVNPTPTAGNSAVALVEQLSGDGTLSRSGTQYELNLGTQEQNGSALWANLGIENGATVPADDLSGQFTITNFTEYLNTGFAPFSSVTPGAADTEPVVSLNTGTIGVFTEQVVLDPTDTNPTGYSAAMNDVTLTVTGTIVPMPLPPPPPVPTAVAWGDVHLTTFDGLLYNFQAVGEFTLAKSTVAGDSFNVQIRTQQWSPGASVSVIDQVAAGIGSDAVTFGLVGTSNQPYAVMLNGNAAVFTNGVLTLADGTVTEESPSSYVVHWDTGESLTVSLGGTYIDTSVALAAQDENGHVEGLLGYDTGVDNDFAPVVSGTTITTDQLYYGNGEGIAGSDDSVADLWRITPASSLLYYANGSDTADYTDLGFPADALQLSDLPANLQQEGLNAAIQAGITDPQVQQAAALDFVVTGDPDIVVGGQNLEQQGITTTASDVTGATITTAVGVAANNAALVEPSSGNLAVGFTVYLTQAEAQATTVDYTVSAPGAGYLDADDFTGDALPGGSVTIAAGQTSASFSVSVPADALGSLPSSDLQVTITPTGGETVFAPSAQTTIVNNQVETGTSSDPIFALLTGEGALTNIGNAYTLSLGNVALGGTVLSLGLAIENTAGAGSNDLAGTLVDPPSTGFSVSGTGPLPTIAPGTSYEGLHVAVNTGTVGTYSETLTFTPEDQNDSGYSSQLTPLTLTITDSVIASSATLAVAGSVMPNPVDFGKARQGATLEQALSVANTATPSAATEALDGSIGAATGAATTNGGSFIGLAAGSTNDTSLVVGLSTTAVGVQSGTATVSLESGGTGIDSNGITPLTSQTIDVVGTVYALAAAQVSPGPLNFGAARLLGTEDLAINVANTASPDGYSEQLLANVLGSSGAISLPSDTTGDINAGGSTTLGVVVNTGTAGTIAAGVTLGLYSDGSNVDGFGTLGIGTQTIAVTGTVYREAAAHIATPVTFVTHVGTAATASIVIANTAAADGFSENLLANIIGESASITPLATATGDIVAGHSAALGLDISAATAGVISGGVTLDLTSDGTGIDGLGTIGIGAETIAVTGTVYNYATAAVTEGGVGTLAGSGSLYTLNLGTVALGSGLTTATLNLDNIATGVADGLSVASSINALNGVFVNNGFGTLATAAAGRASSTMDVSMGSGTAGTFAETLTFALSSTDSGGSTSLTPITIDVTGSVEAPSGQVFVLTTGTDVVNGGATGSNVVLAGNATLSSGDQINAGSGGDNTLALQGGGVFNLTLPSSITNIETITAQEGQPAAVINGVVYQSEVQTVDLRAGMNNVTVQVLPGTPNPNDPSASSITITGAANNDVIELGSGDDTVTLGQGETVDGGSGSDVILVTATTLSGSVITGGSGHTEMYFTGGGTFAMGSNISNVGSIYLASTTSGWNFTANSVANMVIQDASTATSTITAGGMNQTLTGGAAGKLTMVGDATAGSDTTFKDTAALFNGDTLQNFMAGDLIDVTGLGFSSQGTGAGQTSISLSGGKLNVLVSGVQQTSVALPGSFVLADFTVGLDGAGGTLIGYHVSPPS